ncbi:hypothetical protein QR98_0101660, partial [Sarcoptes scabiei]
ASHAATTPPAGRGALGLVVRRQPVAGLDLSGRGVALDRGGRLGGVLCVRVGVVGRDTAQQIAVALARVHRPDRHHDTRSYRRDKPSARTTGSTTDAACSEQHIPDTLDSARCVSSLFWELAVEGFLSADDS